jgi:hypothetical protein
MPRNKWTSGQLKILRKEFPVIDDPKKLCRRLDKTYLAIKSKARVLDIKRKVHAGNPWTPALEKKLIKLYPNMTNAEIGRLLGLRESQISCRAFKLGLFKTEEFKLQCSSKSAFKKGHVPANKDKKQTDYMTKEAIARTKATQFKKGHLPHNSAGVKDGDIRIRCDHKKRKGKAYKYIRLSLGNWYPLHQYNWEKVYGKLPKGKCLWFRDGDPMNCKVSNLELITRAENMRRNSCSVRLTDNYVAMTLAREKGKVGAYNAALLEEIKKDKDLIDTKRAQLLLQRAIKTKSNVKK